MRARPIQLLLLLLVSALAGCAEPPADPPPDDAQGTPSPAPDDDAELERLKADSGRYVSWNLSDHWVYDMEVRGFEASESRLVLYEEFGPEYQIGAETYDEALHQALFGVNPLLGRVHKGLLSPHNRGEHAFMFPFHQGDTIRDGAEWTTTFYGRQIAFRADFDEAIPTPNGTAPGYRIEGYDPNSEFQIAHSYVRSAKWFTYLTVTDEDGLVLDLGLTDVGTGYRGDAHFIRSSTLFDRTLGNETVPLASDTFDVSADLVDRYRVEGFGIYTDIQPGHGTFARLVIKDPDGEEIFEATQEDPAGATVIWPDGMKPEGELTGRPQWPPGEYTIELLGIGASAQLVVVGTQDNSGSL